MVCLSGTNGQTTVASATPPRPIDLPHVQYTDTTADVSWQYTGGVVQSYIVKYSLFRSNWFNSWTLTVPGTQRSVHITGLQPRTAYLVQVAVQNDHGVSEFGPLAFFFTDEGPTSPASQQPVSEAASHPVLTPSRFTSLPPSWHPTTPPSRQTRTPPPRSTPPPRDTSPTSV